MTTGSGIITGVSVSHARAGVDDIEAATRADGGAFLDDLLAADGVEEAFVIQTCNRVEAYVVTDDADRGWGALAAAVPDVRADAVVEMGHERSLRHLMRVAAGLESLVVGEDQIIGQVRDAVEAAEAANALGPLLSDALRKAIHVGERARTETAINEGVVSMGSAAAELARGELGIDLGSARALVVGAGEMGALAARALAAAGADELVVANRTVERAERLVEEVDGSRAVGLDALPSALSAADLVVTATGSDDHLLDRGTLAGAGETAVVDIGQPRDVAPGADALDSVDVNDIDDLEAVTEATRTRRKVAAEEVEAMIDEELNRLLSSFKRKRADAAIGAMYESAEAVKRREVEQAVSKLEAQGELTDEQRETVEAMADALVGQLLAAPTRSLRDAAEEDDWTTIHTAMRLFDPEFGVDGEDAPGAPGAVGEPSSD